MAWFIAMVNDSKYSNEMPIQNLDDSISAIEFHNYVSTYNDGTETYYLFEETPSVTVSVSEGVATQSAPLQMGTYELEDQHHPVLILLELTSGVANISMRITEENFYYVADGDHSLSTENNPLSSVVEFYSFPYSNDEDDPTYVDNRILSFTETVDDVEIENNYYSLKTNEFVRSGTNKNSASFVELDNKGDFMSITGEVNLYSGSAETLSHIGIVVDYYPESLQYIYSYFIGDQTLNYDLPFSCDWEMVL